MLATGTLALLLVEVHDIDGNVYYPIPSLRELPTWS